MSASSVFREKCVGRWALPGRKAQFFFVLFFLLLTKLVWAQTYAYRSEPFTYDAPSPTAGTVAWNTSGASPACTSYPNGDDDWADVTFPSGFAFRFAGSVYTSARVYSNGILAFGDDVSGFHRSYNPTALPAAAPGSYSGCPRGQPQRVMLPYWTDIVAGTANGTSGASVRFELLGSAPGRRFVISFVNVKLYGQTARYNFQAVLWEGDGSGDDEFSFRYSSGSSTGTGATVGVQVSATDFTQYAFNQGFIDTINGTSIRWYPIAISPAQVGEYRLDEAGGWGEVPSLQEIIVDSSGEGNSGRRVALASTFPSAALPGRVCAGATIPNNTLANAISALDLGLSPGQIGKAGTITFWYRSADAWTSSRTLFDATTASNRSFHLTRAASGSGAVLRFVMTDSAGTRILLNSTVQTFAANTWVHIGVSWFLQPGTNQSVMQLFVNGARVGFSRSTTTGVLHNSIASIYFGDNRTSGVTPSDGTPTSANGSLDEIRVYNFDASEGQVDRGRRLTRSNCSPLDHFSIEHAGEGSVCQATRISIGAHDVNHNPVPLVGSVMTLSASSGDGTWALAGATGSLTNLGGGAARYVWNNESVANFTFRSSRTGSVNFDVLSGGISERSGSGGGAHDPSLVLGSCVAGFAACENTSPRCQPGTVRFDRLFTKLSGSGFVLDAVALDGVGALESGFSGGVSLQLLANLQPGTALGGNACPSSSAQVIDAGTLNFVNGRAVSSMISIAGAYRDVRARFSCSSAVCGQEIVVCSPDNFAVRPQAFNLSGVLAGGKLAAGREFVMRADSGVGMSYSGLPQINLSQLVDHANNSSSALSGGFTSNSAGVASGQYRYDDVGSFKLLTNAVNDAEFAAEDAALGDCIAGSGANTASGGRFGCLIASVESALIGRFHPDHFAFNATLTPACGSFIYMDQPQLGVDFVLEARNAKGAVTPRYTAGYSYLGTPSILGENAGQNVSLSRLTPALTTPAWTSGRYVHLQPATMFSRASSPDGPFETFRLRAAVLAEPDGVGIQGALQSNSVSVRHGRLRVLNRIGSEKLDLELPVKAEFWTGKSWVPNVDDSCTTLQAASFFLSGDLAAKTTAAAVNLTNGLGTLRLSKPNPVATGSVDIAVNLGSSGVDQSCLATHGGTPAGLPWLRSRNGSCSTGYDRDPSARASFGIYSPESRKTVHVRELF